LESSSSSSPDAPVARSFAYVGFWKRAVAVVIDVLILCVVSVPLLIAIYGRAYVASARDGGLAGFWDFVIQVVMPAVATILFWKYRGATPGKMVISARVVDAETGGTPGTARLVGRYFAYIVSMLPLGLGFIWVAFDRRKQGFHDKLAGTVVIENDD